VRPEDNEHKTPSWRGAQQRGNPYARWMASLPLAMTVARIRHSSAGWNPDQPVHWIQPALE
jgi:hypothetical protein